MIPFLNWNIRANWIDNWYYVAFMIIGLILASPIDKHPKFENQGAR